MRVAHLLRPAQGGMLRQVRSLLLDPELEPFLAAPPRELAALAEVCPQRCFPLPISDTIRAQVRAGLALGHWARKSGVDILHGHGLNRLPLYVIAAKRARLPLVLTLHNLVPQKQRALVGALLGQTTKVIAVSNAVARTAPVACWVVYNGIDLTRFATMPSQAEARALLGWAQEKQIVLSVARLSPEKGIDVLIQAAQGRAWSTVIVGDGPERRHLEALGDATFLGAREDIPLLMSAADLYCQPSRAEGLGLAVIEAMAAGLAVVASDVGGLPELIPSSKTGALVPVGEVSALQERVEHLLADTPQRLLMGEQARERAHRHFSVEQMRHDTKAIYEAAKQKSPL